MLADPFLFPVLLFSTGGQCRRMFEACKSKRDKIRPLLLPVLILTSNLNSDTNSQAEIDCCVLKEKRRKRRKRRRNVKWEEEER